MNLLPELLVSENDFHKISILSSKNFLPDDNHMMWFVKIFDQPDVKKIDVEINLLGTHRLSRFILLSAWVTEFFIISVYLQKHFRTISSLCSFQKFQMQIWIEMKLAELSVLVYEFWNLIYLFMNIKYCGL